MSDQLQRHRGYGRPYEAVPMLVALCLLCATSTTALALPLQETSQELNFSSGDLPAATEGSGPQTKCYVVPVVPVSKLLFCQVQLPTPDLQTGRLVLYTSGPNASHICSREIIRQDTHCIFCWVQNTRSVLQRVTLVWKNAFGTEEPMVWRDHPLSTEDGATVAWDCLRTREEPVAVTTPKYVATGRTVSSTSPSASIAPPLSSEISMSQAGTVLQTTTSSRPAESIPPHHTVSSSSSSGAWPPLRDVNHTVTKSGIVVSANLSSQLDAANIEDRSQDGTRTTLTAPSLVGVGVSTVCILLVILSILGFVLHHHRKAPVITNRRNADRSVGLSYIQQQSGELTRHGPAWEATFPSNICHTSRPHPSEADEEEPRLSGDHEDSAPTLRNLKSVVETASNDVNAASAMFDPLRRVPPSPRGSTSVLGLCSSAPPTGPLYDHRDTVFGTLRQCASLPAVTSCLAGSENNQPTAHNPEVEPVAQPSFTPGGTNPVANGDFEVDSLLDCSSLDGMGEDDNDLSENFLSLAQAVIREEGHLLRKSSHMLNDAICMSWLARGSVYRFRYSPNTLRPASSADHSAARRSEDLLALTMATNDDIHPFTPRLLAPVVNIKCLTETIPHLRLSHVLIYPVTDGDLADYNLAVLKLNSTQTAWTTHQVLSVADLSAERTECTGTISQTGSFTVALLPKKYNSLTCVIPTIECGHGTTETPTEGATAFTQSQPIPDTTPHDHSRDRRGSGDDNDGTPGRGGGGDGGGGDLTGSPDNSLPRDAILTAYTSKTREYPDEVTVFLKVFYCPCHPADNQLLQRVKRELELQDYIFVLEDIWFLDLGKVKATDEVRVKFRMRGSPGVTVEPEDKQFSVARSAIGENRCSVDFSLGAEADPSAYIRCGMPVKVLPGEISPLGREVLRFKVPPMMSAEPESAPSQASQGNESVFSMAIDDRDLLFRLAPSSSESVYPLSESSRASCLGGSVSQSSAEELTLVRVISPGYALEPSATPHTRTTAAASAWVALVSAHGEAGSVATLDSITEDDEVGHHLQTHRPGRHANHFNVQGIHSESEHQAAEDRMGRMSRALRPLPLCSRAVCLPPSLHSVSVNRAQMMAGCGSVQGSASQSESMSVHSLAAASQHGSLASQRSDWSSSRRSVDDGYFSPPEPGFVRQAAEPESAAPRSLGNEDTETDV